MSYIVVKSIQYTLLSDVQSFVDNDLQFKPYADWKSLPIAPKSSLEINDKESGGATFYELKYAFDIGNQSFLENLKQLLSLSKWPIIAKFTLQDNSWLIVGDLFNPCELTQKFETDTNRFKLKLTHNQSEPYFFTV